ncbi:hypothetical protein GCS91_20440 [Delftia tsuruhatensis]|nr:hypothetical protein GCS91_20440 [Delftia tsuruhatensis]
MKNSRFKTIPKKSLRKPSARMNLKVKRRVWRMFSVSENGLARTKLMLGVLVTLVALITGLLTLLRIYASDEATFKRYADRAVAWHYKTEQWNGYFSNWSEGLVNIAELNLSETSMALALQATGNTIDGGMSEKKLCGIIPPQDFKLVRGTISHFGNSASITIFEFVRGYTTVYAEFDLRHDGLVLEVTPKRNSRWFGKETLRLIQEHESSIDTGFEKMKGFCKEEQLAFREMLKKSYEKIESEEERN